MKKIAVIGGGVSGLSAAHFLRDAGCDVRVYEKEKVPGGLIRCKRVSGSLFHICGGHVFNTKNQKVADWFWSKFNRERDFVKAERRSAVCLGQNQFVDYPIENHVYQLDAETQRGFYADIENMLRDTVSGAKNFEDFLLKRFGRTLYELYFKPYNQKVWRCNLADVPLSWLAGKLPMPTPQEMLYANRCHVKERDFVHSTFYYEVNGGSQFIADELAKGLEISYGVEVREIDVGRGCRVNGESYDGVVFCGNVKDLPGLLKGTDVLDMLGKRIVGLESHGTTAVFCETDQIPYSWFYQPSPRHQSHRFICTGNFAPSNNAPGKMTCTVEFTDEISREEILEQLKLMPYHPKYLTHHYSEYTYPIQHADTREMIKCLREKLMEYKIQLVGRFAEWEYYNMDFAINSAMQVRSFL